MNLMCESSGNRQIIFFESSDCSMSAGQSLWSNRQIIVRFSGWNRQTAGLTAMMIHEGLL